MLKTALQPRWLPLHVLMVAAVVTCVLLGGWQLGSARQSDSATSEHAGSVEAGSVDAAPAELTAVISPRQTFPGDSSNRPVTARGRYDAQAQLLVAGRELEGRTGYWLLTPLLVGDAAVPVVRGWVASAQDPAAARDAVPSGEVEVTGRLLASEPTSAFRPAGATELPAGQLVAVDTVELVNRWPYPLYNAFVVLTAQEPGSDVAAVPPPPDRPGGQLSLRNLAYGAQWWIFGGFTVFLWWRILRDAANGDPDPDPAFEPQRQPDPQPQARGALR